MFFGDVVLYDTKHDLVLKTLSGYEMIFESRESAIRWLSDNHSYYAPLTPIDEILPIPVNHEHNFSKN